MVWLLLNRTELKTEAGIEDVQNVQILNTSYFHMQASLGSPIDINTKEAC